MQGSGTQVRFEDFAPQILYAHAASCNDPAPKKRAKTPLNKMAIFTVQTLHEPRIPARVGYNASPSTRVAIRFG